MPYWFVLAVNAMPIFAVLGFGWSALTLMVLYWLENVIIGAFNLLKILMSSFTSPFGFLGIFAAPFFVFHYGLFCAVHGVFLFAFFAVAGTIAAPEGTDPFRMIEFIVGLLENDRTLLFGAAWLAALHLADFCIYWLGHGEWKNADPFSQMFEPYGRIIMLHLVIFLAAVPVLLLGQPLIGVVLLALLKTAVELNWWNPGTGGDHAKRREAIAETIKKLRAGRNNDA